MGFRAFRLRNQGAASRLRPSFIPLIAGAAAAVLVWVYVPYMR